MYTYGQPAYLAKLIIKRSYDSWNQEHGKSLEEQYEEAMPKLKGYFIPNLYLGNNHTIDVIRSFEGVDFAVKKLIAACYVDYMVVKKAFDYPINEPNIKYIKKDIDELMFARITHNKPVDDYIRGTWEVYPEFIIKNIRDKVINEWQGYGPCDEIKNFFKTTSYYYKKRNTKHSWLDDMRSYQEIAKYMLDHLILEIDGSLQSAFKHRHIRVKCVQRWLSGMLNQFTYGELFDLRSTSKCKQWLAKLTPSQITDIKGMLGMEDSMLQVTLIKAYGLDLEVNIDTVRKLLAESGETRK